MTAVDRRFGTWNKFGTTNKFGASSGADANLYWGVEVDWDDDHIYDGANEDQYLISLRGSRGRQRYLALDGNGFEKIQTGMYYLTLDNTSGRYDAWNTSSPLYPNVNYGKDIKITVRDVSSGTIYPIFVGIIQDIQPQVDIDGNAQITITAADGWSILRNNNAYYPIQQNINPGTAIGNILGSIGWIYGTNLDTGSDTIRYWWANADKTAGAAIEDIAQSFVSYFFIAADGRATYINRLNVADSIENLTESVLLKDFSLPQPWQNSRNVTRIKAHPRTAASSGVVYQLVGNTPTVQTGSSNALTIFGNYTYNNIPVPAITVIQPVATTDYTMNTAADGSGTDKTANCSVVAYDFGDRVQLVITNSSGGTVYITKLQVRAQALYETNVSDVVYPSVLPNTPRRFVLDLPWQQDVNVAVDFSNLIGPYLADNHPFPIVQIEGRPDLQFAPDLFDIVILTTSKYGILGNSFRVGYIEHQTLGNCQAVRTKFYLEDYIAGGDYWVWDTNSDFDTTTIFGA